MTTARTVAPAMGAENPSGWIVAFSCTLHGMSAGSTAERHGR